MSTEDEQILFKNVSLVNDLQQQTTAEKNSALIKNGPSIPRTPDINSKGVKIDINDEMFDTQTIMTNLSITDSVNNNNENGLKPYEEIQKSEVEFHLSDEEEAAGTEEAGCEESDAHLPKVRVELDRLNYANESINNLELELVEAKREFLEVLRHSETELERCEKKIGNQHVIKSMAYYEERMALNLAKQKYLNAKFRFETAQELYVAAKNVQMYAEENLEDAKELSMSGKESGDASGAASVTDSMNLMKMHKMAKVKVSEAEFSKQSCDLEQIESFKVYELSLKRVEQLEKRFKSSITKSLKYFQLKSCFNKELQFFALKIDGLKSCLREAKTTYQQSLKNLEKISTEVHLQRSFNNSKVAGASNSSLTQKSISPDSSTSTISSTNATNSHSSPNLATMTAQQADEMEAHKLRSRSNSLSTLTETSKHVGNAREDIERSQSTETEEEEDYDKIFNDSILKSESERSFTKTVHYSQKLDKNAVCLLTDEEIESLRLDKKIRKCESELLGRKTVDLEVQSTSDKSSTSSGVDSNVVVVESRPQFRVPFFSKTPLFQP